MSERLRTWLVVNAGSGGNTPASVKALLGTCDELGCVIARTIEFPDEPLPTAEQLAAAGVDRLVVFAGDGTVNSCVTGLYGWGGAVLVLPGGTMNLLAQRLHGGATVERILACFAAGAALPVRPLVARTSHGDALAGLLAGPGTAWFAVREALRAADVAGVIGGASEALSETTGGSMLHCREPDLGRESGYPLIQVTPGEWGLQIDAYHAERAGDYLLHGWAMLRHRFREGPHDRLGLTGKVTLADTGGGTIGLLIDGEPADGGTIEEIGVARCEVDLLATGHG